MSQQYNGVPQFGTNYHIAPPYPTFPTDVTQSSPSSTMYQQTTMQAQPHQVPIPQANDIRFNANMQIPAQAAPFPFPPSMNSELFKHFPPLPPPPPPLSFNSSPGTPVSFSQFPGHAAGMPPVSNQSYMGALNGPAGQNGGFIANPFSAPAAFRSDTQQSGPPASDSSATRPVDRIASSYAPSSVQPYQSRVDSQRVLQDVNDDESDMYDPANAFRMPSGSTSYARPTLSATKASKYPHGKVARTADSPISHNDSAEPVYSQAELKEKAKAAILSLSSHRITYHDLRTEGLHPELLQSLFEELGLDMTIGRQDIALQKSTVEKPSQSTTVSDTMQAMAAMNVKERDANNGPSPKQMEAINRASAQPTSGMERKDRIAQLLAAKAAKGNVAHASSASTSPAPSMGGPAPPKVAAAQDASRVSDASLARHSAVHSTAQAIAIAETVKQQLLQFKNVAGELSQSVSGSGTPIDASLLIPTPIRETLAEHGLSSLIPGLFETDEEQMVKQPLPNLNGAGTEASRNLQEPTTNPSSTRKRSADWLADSEQNTIKRAALSQDNAPTRSMDTDSVESGEASEGEIVEDENIDSVREAGQQQQHRHGQNTDMNKGARTDATAHLDSARQSQDPSLKKLSATETLRASATTSSPRPISRLTPAQLAEKAAALKADLLRQRRIRQQQLTEGMPALNEEVIKTQQRIEQSKIKLADIRGQLQKYEAEAMRARENERDLLEEIRRLELQLEEGMTGQKRFSDELQVINSETTGNAPRVSKASDDAMLTSASQHNDIATSINGQSAADQDLLGPPQPTHQSMASPDKSVPASPQNAHELDSAIATESLATSRSMSSPSIEEQSNIQASAVVDQNAVKQPQPELMYDTEIGAKDVSDENMESDLISEDSRMSIDDEDEGEDSDDGSEGSASMSDSGSEDYEPAEPEPTNVAEVHRDDSEEYEPEIDATPQSLPEEDAADYEPSAPIEVADTEVTPAYQPQESVQQSPIHEEIDTLAKSGNSSIQPPSQIPEVAAQTITNDEERGLQTNEANTSIKDTTQLQRVDVPNGLRSGSETNLSTSPFYVPYQSPLSAFKSYRFHSSFSDQVKNGYRSLTYSNNIDPKKPICPAELSGTICSDPSCEEQHFESMALTDDKILIQMSDANDIADKALRDEYLGGLKQVIAGLRQDNVKDFSEVASALSKYRRDWAEAHLNV